jgi:hypothetical protein
VEQLEHASNAELLSKLTGKSVAEALMQQYGGLNNLAKASFDELQLVKGMGQSEAAAIKSAFLLAQRLNRESYPESPLLDEPERVAYLLREESPTRKLKIESDGDSWKGLIKPKIRLTGRWLERAGFSPGSHVQVVCVAPGFIELRSPDPNHSTPPVNASDYHAASPSGSLKETPRKS